MKGSWLPESVPPDLMGRARLERVGGTFDYYIPPFLAGSSLDELMDRDTREYAIEVGSVIMETTLSVDDDTRRSLYPLLLKSESIASSRIERIDASPRDVSYAQLDDDASHLKSHNAMNIARNMEATALAMENLSTKGRWSVEDVESVHRALGVPGVNQKTRSVDVWIGGNSRLRAQYVAPPPDRVRPLLADLLEYVDTSGEHPLIAAAVAHVQFESIHPFEDGNGRTGRSLVHAALERGGVTRSGLLPVSTILRRRTDEYISHLSRTRTDDHDEAIESLDNWVHFFASVAEESCSMVRDMQTRVTELDERMDELSRGLRRDSSARRIIPLLTRQPVVTARFISEHLGVSPPAAHGALEELVTRRILSPGAGRYKRSAVYQANDVLGLLDEGFDIGADPPLRVPGRVRRNASNRCGQPLPRKGTPCGLRKGHPGPHRTY